MNSSLAATLIRLAKHGGPRPCLARCADAKNRATNPEYAANANGEDKWHRPPTSLAAFRLAGHCRHGPDSGIREHSIAIARAAA
jgi:hypothetical protein